MILKSCYDIYTAADGQEALHIIKGRKIHLITLDLNIPKLSGIETLREIGKIDPEVPVVIIKTSTRGGGMKNSEPLKAD